MSDPVSEKDGVERLEQVERTLKVIRGLMERGTVYEAITARGALLAGLAALVTSLALWRLAPGSEPAFLWTWGLVALAATAWVALTGFLQPPAANAGRRRVSLAARTIGREVLPAYAVAVVLSVALVREGEPQLLPAAWMLLHGVAILATATHAPSRLVRLGAAFVLAGAVAAFVPLDRNLAMSLGFGGLNLAYGLLARTPAVAD